MSLGGQWEGTHSNDLLPILHHGIGKSAFVAGIFIAIRQLRLACGTIQRVLTVFTRDNARNRWMRGLIVLLLWALSTAGHAVVVSDLYQVRVPVVDQSQTTRQQGIQQAFQQVVVKVSGFASSTQHEAIQTAFATADSFVGSYRYQRDGEDNTLFLEVNFAQNQIDGLLRRASLPLWGNSRPLVVLWQAVEENRARKVLSQEADPWHILIERAMNERGIPLLWPARDMDDEMALPVSRLWGLFRVDILKASERYMSDAQMAGRLVQLGGQWQYQGFLKHGDDMLDIEALHEDPVALMHNVTDQVATFMAERYAVQGNVSAGEQRVVIDGVKNFQEYQNVIKYLKANIGIKQVQVVAAEQHRVTLDLSLVAPWAQVWGSLSLDKRLVATEQENTLRWQY